MDFPLKIPVTKEQEEKFRAAYAVLYENEAAIIEAMNSFDFKWGVIPEIFNTPSRRELVERLLSGKRMETDPYGTGLAFHFEDIKYFTGETPIDVVLYASENPISNLKKSDSGERAMTALKNCSVNIRHIFGFGWDTSNHDDPITQYFMLANSKYEKMLQLESPKNDFPAEQSGTTGQIDERVQTFSPAPILIIEPFVSYGRKHEDIEYRLRENDLGIRKKSLVFCFTGETVIDPYSVPSKVVINKLNLI